MNPPAMESEKAAKKILIGITGASGMIFVKPFLEVLSRGGTPNTIHGICSESGRSVLQHETGFTPEKLPGVSKWFRIDDFGAAPSSGSSGYDAMVVLPCTMGSLAAIAGGLSLNLIHRAADVMLKERKKIVLAVRETPLNRTHLQNMLKAHDAGAVICPPMPGYYLKPKSLDQAALTYCWRLADQLGIDVKKRERWTGENYV